MTVKSEDKSLSSYSAQDAEVMALGGSVGFKALDDVKETVVAMDQRQRLYFFSAFLRLVVNCMKASIGIEATMAILDTAKEYLTNG